MDAQVWPTFDDFWDEYQKKIDRPKCEKYWKKLKQCDKEKIIEHVKLYIESTPDKQFRKHPSTYLNNRSWENEIIKPNETVNKKDRSEFINSEINTILAYSRSIIKGGS